MKRLARVAMFLLFGSVVACEPETEIDPIFPAEFAARWPVVRDCRFSVEHDGVHIMVHASPAAADAYVAGQYPFAAGTVLVKREFEDGQCTTPSGFTAMRRLADGEAPEVGDWEWQHLDAQRTVLQSGALESCASCHRSCTMGRDLTCTDP